MTWLMTELLMVFDIAQFLSLCFDHCCQTEYSFTLTCQPLTGRLVKPQHRTIFNVSIHKRHFEYLSLSIPNFISNEARYHTLFLV